ncbi:MAG: cell wall metabolism sensor histidine kinase WalK [Nannocystaceae bacterium]|nr:cell wall metabolism sensor histidine kinase WalK [Nannocystaceae bacterium]
MSLGIRGKLFLLATLMIAAVVGSVGFYVEHSIEASLQSRLELELFRHAKTTGVLLEHRRAGDGFDEVADRVADATRSEVWIFDLQGQPVGSSTMAPLELLQLARTSSEPEIGQAARAERGVAIRPDAQGDLHLFVAVKVAAPKQAVVVRASASLATVQGALLPLRIAAVAAGLAGLMIAGVLLAAVGSQVERALKPVVSSAAAANKGADSGEGDSAHGDEGPQSLRTVAVDLERTMGALSTERNRFEAVLQTLEQAVLVLDADEKLITVNRAAYGLLSLPERAVGRSLLEAVRVPRLKALAAAAAEGGRHHDEFELPSGLRVDVRATRHDDEGVVIVAQDITEVRHLERVRRDFVANVSHELRTPISVIRANAETLLDGALDDPKVARMFVEATHRHSDRLGRIVTDLLDISRIEAGRYSLSPTNLNVGDVVDQVLDLVESKATEKGIELSVTIEPELDMYADRKAMEHILINLVSNAFKYTPENGKVEVTAHAPTPNRVRIEVLDDGPGIDPAHRERIFERFFRVDSGRSRDMGGTGLGLSIVKNLVEAQRGEVGVDPRSPTGSIFWFTLPAARPKSFETETPETATS